MTLSRPQTDVLIFVEDPGAANFIAGLPDILEKRGRTVHVATDGVATSYLQKRNVTVNPLPPNCDLGSLVAGLNPKLLAVGTAENPDSFGLKLTAIAKARRIISVGLVDSSTNLAFRFRGRSANPLEFCPDSLIMPDARCRDGFINLGIAGNRIAVTGHPHWDFVRDTHRSFQQKDRSGLRQRLFKLSNRDRKVIQFAAEISDGMSPGQFQRSKEYTLTGRGASTGRTEIVIEEFLDALAPRRRELYLVLRLHPKHKPGDLSAYATEFDYVSQSEPSLEVVYAADAVVGMTSMLMIEAALMERPTLAILPRAREAQWLPTNAAGITPHASSRDALRERITALLDNPQPPPFAALAQLFPPGASERVAASLEALLAR